MNPLLEGIACPKCHSEKLTTNGTSKRKGYRVMQYICLDCGHNFSENTAYNTILKENVKYKKQVQRLNDTNRIERKAFREHARVENAVEEYNKEILSILNSYDLSKYTVTHPSNNNKAVGVVHLSDLHLNELVDVISNRFDFDVASKRLKLFAESAINYFTQLDVKNILIADTGDKLNSDRRLDELLNQATNRSNATMLSVHLLKQFILHLNQYFNISYACVTGNESRVKDEHGFSKILATDNYDFTIFNILRYMFTGSDIVFILGDPSELIVDVVGQKILLVHGDSITADVTKSITGIKGKYADKGILITFVMFGHIHEARIADSYSRGSSLVGDNAYSFTGLNLTGRASQNIHIFYENGNRDSIKIDLQNTDGVKGYDIIKELEAYNAKSASKLHKGESIFKVVI